MGSKAAAVGGGLLAKPDIAAVGGQAPVPGLGLRPGSAAVAILRTTPATGAA